MGTPALTLTLRRFFLLWFAVLFGVLFAADELTSVRHIDTKKARAVAYEHGHVYVADDKGGLKIIGEANGAWRIEGSFARKKTRYFDVLVAESIAYLAAYDKGVDIVDISNPAEPKLLATLPTDNLASALSLQNDILYVADRKGGVIVADVHDPSAPKRLSAVKTYQAQDVLARGNVLYVADGKGGVKTFEISDPSKPALLGGLKTGSKTRALAFDNGTLYVAGRYKGVHFIDVASPAKPKLLRTVDTEGKAIAVAVKDGKVYVGDGEKGLVVLDGKDGGELTRYATPSKLRGIAFDATGIILAVNNAGVSKLQQATPPAKKEAVSMHPLSEATWSGLSKEARLAVAHKLLSTLYYGVDTDDYETWATSEGFLEEVRALFTREAEESTLQDVESKLPYYAEDYRGTESGKEVAKILARLYLLPPSKSYVDYWSTYILTQTILFSPAVELPTVEDEDLRIVYYDLFDDIHKGLSIADSTYNHMISQSNWRRFRSPEDNGREMLEIYLMDFEDAHVPLAAKALQNWHLDRQHNLVVGDNENNEPISGLFPGKTVTNGYDFYEAIVDDARFLPTVTRRLVQIYFPNFSAEEQEKIVNGLLERNPSTWSDLLLDIAFSEKYLMESARMKSFEEIFLPAVKSLGGWMPKAHTFYYVQGDMALMHQASMRYKLGRSVTVPSDTESLGWMHRKLRERVLVNYRGTDDPASSDDGIGSWKRLPDALYVEGEFDENGKVTDIWFDQERKRSDYITQTFISALGGRSANAEEKGWLGDYIDGRVKNTPTYRNRPWIDLHSYDNPDRDLKYIMKFSFLVLDYVSRLSETYTFFAVSKGGEQ